MDREAVATTNELERELARRIGQDKVAVLRDAPEADWV